MAKLSFSKSDDPPKPIASTQSKTPPLVTWTKTIESLRTRAETEAWRLHSVHYMPAWSEFCVAWLSCASGLPALVEPDTVCPPDATDFNDKLAWAWSCVQMGIDPVILVIDSRTNVSTALIQQTFESMQGAGLIFPDGSMNKLLIDKLNRQVNLMSAREQAEINKSLAKAAEARRKIEGVDNGKAKK